MTLEDILSIYHKPLLELVYEAATVHRQYHDSRKVQISTLLSIKTGGCPEDCAYCPQAARYYTGVQDEPLMSREAVMIAAMNAKEGGASRLCMGAAWRNVKEGPDFEHVLDLVSAVNGLDMEVCCTLGMINASQAQRLADAGLYAYNHNLDSSDEYYKEIISTRSYDDRLKTLSHARRANLTVCSGGIIGMGESVEDRCKMLLTLRSLDPQPESVPINALVAVEGTPLEELEPIPVWEMIRMVATTRIVLPHTTVRLSAGRTQMSREGQALCFMAGAASIFAGEKLLTTPNPDQDEDMEMLRILGLEPAVPFERGRPVAEDTPVTAPEAESVRWARPGHRIDRNVTYTAIAKEKRKTQRSKTVNPES